MTEKHREIETPGHRGQFTGTHGVNHSIALSLGQQRLLFSTTIHLRKGKAWRISASTSASLHGIALSKATLRRKILGRICTKASPDLSHHSVIPNNGRLLHAARTITPRVHRKRVPTTSLLALQPHRSVVRSGDPDPIRSTLPMPIVLANQAGRARQCTVRHRPSYHYGCASRLLHLVPRHAVMLLYHSRPWRGRLHFNLLHRARCQSRRQTGIQRIHPPMATIAQDRPPE